jgi:hypothetical protein
LGIRRFPPQLGAEIGVYTGGKACMKPAGRVAMNPNELALLYRFHGGGRSGFEFVLLLAGLAFAGVLVWAIQRSGRSTT